MKLLLLLLLSIVECIDDVASGCCPIVLLLFQGFLEVYLELLLLLNGFGVLALLKLHLLTRFELHHLIDIKFELIDILRVFLTFDFVARGQNSLVGVIDVLEDDFARRLALVAVLIRRVR